MVVVTWADDRFLITKNQVETQEMTSEVVDALRKKQAAVAMAKVKGWVANELFAIQVDGRTIRGQCEFRALGLLVGARNQEIRTTAAWKGFWSSQKALTARSSTLSVCWVRCEAAVAPVLAFRAWSWRWSHDVGRGVTTPQ